jgi:arabinofuranosyltransferase
MSVGALWIPVLLIALVILAVAGRAPGRLTTLWAVCLVAALVHAVWVVRVGGDFMHARMLLADWFLVLSPVAVLPLEQCRRAGVAVALAVMTGWSVWSWASVRAPEGLSPLAPAVTDERSFYAAAAGKPHPVTIEDHAGNPLTAWGTRARKAADAGEDVLWFPQYENAPTFVSSGGSVVVSGNIGMIGMAAGPDVTVVDSNGLSDAIAARVDAALFRPGHRREQVDRGWVTSRFGAPGEAATAQRRAAEDALRCGALAELMDATTSPMTPALFVRNLARSPELTRLRLAADPRDARRDLC